MSVCRTYHRKKIFVAMSFCTLLLLALMGRVCYITVFCEEQYKSGALQVHQREREIKAPRGMLLDRNNQILASNRTVCTISVIHSQIQDPEEVIEVLSSSLDMSREEVEQKVRKNSSRERIKSNVEKAVGDEIRNHRLAGVKVDEDYKRTYIYDKIASKVLGFTGSDNQGIIGLEARYNEILQGTDGKILTLTDAAGRELPGALEERRESIPGKDLKLSLDVDIQQYATQLAETVMEEKQANYVSILAMNPQNGEILAMVNVPEYNLNDPYTLNYQTDLGKGTKEYLELLNKMWRNQSINDTYEPGSTFKVITAAAGLEEEVVTIDSTFSCPGYKMVEDRRIRCHKTAGHGAEDFLHGVMNSCNPVFMTVGERLGVDNFYKYLVKLGLTEKTGVDLSGEAGIILHQKKNVGPVELATMTFGQSFQVTPIGLLRSISAVINGGRLVTPHFGVSVIDEAGKETLCTYPVEEGAISAKTSETMQYILEQVVAEGTGHKGYVEGFRIGGKTATSQKLPRSAGKYIASYVGFAPAENPQVIAMAIIDEPKGVYYGGTVAAPVIQKLYQVILPNLLEK